MSASPWPEIDIAAGGLLLRNEGAMVQLALVRRPRYGDIALPKGHPNPGEALPHAALREVLEETGCRAGIERMIEPVSYLVDDRSKLVVFYLMRCLESGKPRDSQEVSEVLWLPPSEAVSHMTDASERALVASTLGQ